MRNELDDVLMRRSVPQARAHLAEMIIAAARPRAETPRPRWSDFIGALQDAFILPHPALALAFILVIGLSFGLYTGSAEAAQEGAAGHELSSFMKVKDSFDVGEWL